MLIYAIMLPISLLVSLICYATNPIVLLFCDEEGELPGVLSLWQTWDNSCNPSDLLDIVPGFLMFDWSRHYEEYEGTTKKLADVGRMRWFCRVIDPQFTIWERIQRYLCRCIWLTRNCAYGWSFWVFGRTIEPDSVVITKQIDDEDGKLTVARVRTEKSWKAPFLYKNDRYFIGHLVRWCIFAGWKIDYKSNTRHRAMIAGRLAVRFGRGS